MLPINLFIYLLSKSQFYIIIIFLYNKINIQFAFHAAYCQGEDRIIYRGVDSPPESASLMDDEARRLIEDAKLYIHRDYIVLLEVVGQGMFSSYDIEIIGIIHRNTMKYIRVTFQDILDVCIEDFLNVKGIKANKK